MLWRYIRGSNNLLTLQGLSSGVGICSGALHYDKLIKSQLFNFLYIEASNI